MNSFLLIRYAVIRGAAVNTTTRMDFGKTGDF
jgi:hypothetical protein